MKLTYIVLLLGLLLSGSVVGQDRATQAPLPQDDPSITAGSLLKAGYEVKSVIVVNGLFVFTLQRGQSAYVCEADDFARSRVCLPIQ